MNNGEPYHEISRGMKKLTMCAIWFSTFSFGLAYNFLPSALIELKNKFGTTIDEISKVFTVMLLAYLLGALTCGVLFNYINRQLTVVCILYLMAAGVVMIPYVPSMSLFYTAGGILGFASGGYDTSQVVWTLELWHGEAGVYIQAEYFFFALGTFVAPILAAPFLQEEHLCLKKVNCSGASNHTDIELHTSVEDTALHIPALISGAVVVTGATIIFMFFIFKRYEPPPPSRKGSLTASELLLPTNRKQENFKRRWVLITLCAALLGCYQGMEICTLQFMPTFSHYIGLKLSEPDGAAVLSGVAGAFTVGRFLGILACLFRAKPAGILAGNLGCALVGNVVLLLWANESLVALWVGGILLGLGYSTVFACVYDYIESHVRVTNIVSAVMVISGSIVGAVYPLIVGNAVEHAPFVLMQTIFVSLAVCTVTFLGIYWLTAGDVGKTLNSGQVHTVEENF